MIKLVDAILLFSTFPLIHAQYAYSNDSPTTAMASSTTMSASASSGTYTAGLREDGFIFSPASLAVSPGEKVEFYFYPQNQSVAQASFEHPCQPMDGMGFFSGFVPTSEESKSVFTLTINNTDPIWYYCGQESHCQAGMAGVINPSSNGQDTLASFKNAASKTTSTTVPPSIQGGVLANANEGSGTMATSGSASKTSSSISNTPSKASAMSAAGEISVLLVLSSLISMFMA